MTHYVHPFIHLRTGHKYEKSRWFKYLLKRHIWHHRDIPDAPLACVDLPGLVSRQCYACRGARTWGRSSP
jgi:hypothetical protein